MNIKWLLLPAIILLDYWTKHRGHMEIVNHYKTIPFWALLFLIPLAVMSVRNRRYLLPAAVMITGGLLNYFDSLDGLVINPFVVIVGTMGIGFNVADVAILTGFLYCVKESLKERKEKKAKRMGSVEWTSA